MYPNLQQYSVNVSAGSWRNSFFINGTCATAQTIFLTWNDGHLIAVVRHFQEIIQVSHDALKRVRHQVKRPIRVNHRIFFEGTEIFLGDDGIHETLIPSGRKGSRRRGRHASAP